MTEADVRGTNLREETDRTLLEYAAKAAGYDKDLYWPYCIKDKKYSPAWIKGGMPWNPIGNDGDALRLAVKLNMAITVSRHKESHCEGTNQEYAFEKHNDDPYAATRRAIVRAAAEIGKAMESKE